MKNRMIWAVGACCSLATAVAQAPVIEWQRALGGSNDEVARCVVPTADGGYIVAGATSSGDGDVSFLHSIFYDAWVVKLDSTGTIQWETSLGGSAGDYAMAVAVAADGGYFISAYASSSDGDVTNHHGASDIWVVKLDTAGTIQWQKALGGTGNELSGSIASTADGGCVVAGRTASTNGNVSGNHGLDDMWVVKLGPTGTIQWTNALGGTGLEDAASIATTADGGYLVTGHATSNDGDLTTNLGSFDWWVVKLDSSGTLVWQHVYGGSSLDEPHSIAPTADGGSLVTGLSASADGDITNPQGNGDCWVVKLDDTGTIQWQRSLGGSGYDEGFSIAPTPDGGSLVAGKSESTDGDLTNNHGAMDFWVLKLDASGTILWQSALGGSDEDHGYSIAPTTDGGCVAAGMTGSSDGDVTNLHGQNDCWVVKLSGTFNTLVAPVEAATVFSVSPNPATEMLQVRGAMGQGTLVLTDAMGREVLAAPMGTATRTLDVAHFPRGLYTLMLRTAQGDHVQRVVLE